MRKFTFSTTFLAIIACLLWSTAFVGVKIGLQYTTPLQFAGIRFFLAGAIVFVILGKYNKNFRLLVKEYKQLLRIGLFQTFIAYAFFYMGISVVPAAHTAIIIGAIPLFTSLTAHAFLKNDRLSRKNFFSIILGITGVVILALNRQDFSWAEGKEFWGIMILICANISSSFGNVFVVKYRTSLPPILLSSGQLMLGGAGLFLASIPFEGLSFGINDLPYYISLAWLTLISAVAFSIWYVLLERPATLVSELNFWKFLIPVFGATLSWLLIPAEKPGLAAITGMIFIGLSLIVLNIKKRNGKNLAHNGST